MGGVIDGFPSGFQIDFDLLNEELALRRPGSSRFVTARNEKDIPEFLSGISPDGKTLGTPIGFIIRNTDCRPADYSSASAYYRPNHADYTYSVKYGLRDARGGGRSSARETVSRVVAGALALQWLACRGIIINAELSGVGECSAVDELNNHLTHDPAHSSLQMPPQLKEKMQQRIMEAKVSGDSVGGTVSCLISGVPAGIGAPVGDKLQSRLAQAMLSINAAKGFEYGLGFESAKASGSESADSFLPPDEYGNIRTATNYSGGIQGGITNGMPIFFTVAFKPTPTIMKSQPTIDVKGNAVNTSPAGRHDPCVAVRAVSVVKSMAALVVMDMMLGD